MYNFRARARTALSGSVQTQEVGVRGSPNLSNQVTPTQALQILNTEKENVTETACGNIERCMRSTCSECRSNCGWKYDKIRCGDSASYSYQHDTFGGHTRPTGFYIYLFLFIYLSTHSVPINTDTHSVPINTDTHSVPINTDTHSVPINTDTHGVPIESPYATSY